MRTSAGITIGTEWTPVKFLALEDAEGKYGSYGVLYIELDDQTRHINLSKYNRDVMRGTIKELTEGELIHLREAPQNGIYERAKYVQWKRPEATESAN